MPDQYPSPRSNDLTCVRALQQQLVKTQTLTESSLRPSQRHQGQTLSQLFRALRRFHSSSRQDLLQMDHDHLLQRIPRTPDVVRWHIALHSFQRVAMP